MRRLHLGCGATHKKGYINIDSTPLPSVDLVRDVLRGLPFDDESVDEIYSENFLEHVPQTEVIWIMNEMHRVMKSGCISHHLIPEAGTTLFFQDPTHLSHWCFATFTYFEQGHRRNEYYGSMIKPWVIQSLTHTEPNKLIDVVLRKP